MIVIKNHHECEDPINYLGFEELSHLGKDCLFFYGGYANDKVFEHSDLPKYFFSTEEQTWDLDTTYKFENYVDTVFTICPSQVTNRPKRKNVFFPFNENFIPTSFNKKYDVVYSGFATGNHVSDILNTIVKFNYRFISFSPERIVTDRNVTYKEKLNIISETKINVIHNLTGNGTPQLKTRPFESAFCKSLILCRRDNWNIIEEWFEPNKEFLYYENSVDLEILIRNVLENYDDYLPIINSAYNRAINNYTTRHFIEKYLS